MKILVVDDMLSMRKVMITMLRSLGPHSLDEAENGIEALKKLKAQDFDLLIPLTAFSLKSSSYSSHNIL